METGIGRAILCVGMCLDAGVDSGAAFRDKIRTRKLKHLGWKVFTCSLDESSHPDHFTCNFLRLSSVKKIIAELETQQIQLDAVVVDYMYTVPDYIVKPGIKRVVAEFFSSGCLRPGARVWVPHSPHGICDELYMEFSSTAGFSCHVDPDGKTNPLVVASQKPDLKELSAAKNKLQSWIHIENPRFLVISQSR